MPLQGGTLLARALAAATLLLAAEPPRPAPAGGTPLPPVHVQVEAPPPQRVTLSVSVTDRAGEPVTGLGREAFEVLEDGRSQALLDFGVEAQREDRPLSAVVLVDRSGSVSQQLTRWRQACAALREALRPIDEVRVATFTSEVRILHDFTRGPIALQQLEDDLQSASGGTRVFLALDETLHDLARRPGRKAIFLMTDGLDNDRPSEWTARSDPYIERLLRLAVTHHVTVLTILPGPTGRGLLAVQDFAERSGGWWLYPGDDLAARVRALGQRLLASYMLTYDSPSDPADRRTRRVEVRVRGGAEAGYQVRTVDGVFGAMPLLDLLREDLADDDPVVRAGAAAGLGQVADPGANGPLRKALGDESPQVRAAAAAALGVRGAVEAARGLARLLRDPDASVREAAIAALTQLLSAARAAGDAGTEEKILEALEEEGR